MPVVTASYPAGHHQAAKVAEGPSGAGAHRAEEAEAHGAERAGGAGALDQEREREHCLAIEKLEAEHQQVGRQGTSMWGGRVRRWAGGERGGWKGERLCSCR